MRRRNRHYDARGRRLAPRPPDPPEGMMWTRGGLMPIERFHKLCAERCSGYMTPEAIRHCNMEQERKSAIYTEDKLRNAGV